ncbi:MAG TPA: hypothetical protein PLV92_11240 [Pirellulaceae bacterium]|jgi:hypothetical protein|nr:hypothetical protein [Pirellulaceae bacterium]
MRNRGKRSIKFYFSVGGAQIAGSMAEAKDFNYTPDASIDEVTLIGDPETKYETDIKGHGFSLTHYEKDAEGAKVWDSIVTAYANGDPQPDISLTVLTDYVDPSVPPRTEVFSSIAMKCDSLDVGDGYVMRKWSGKASSYKVF